jgi:hypothetical protein
MTEFGTFEELKYRIVRNESETIYYNSSGQKHRDDDLPAIIWADGAQEWYVNGRRHRDNGLPAFIDPDGTQYWYVNGKFVK